MNKRNKLWLSISLTVVSALLATAAFPPLNWSFIAIVAWLPFLLALKDKGWKTSLLLGLLHGMCFFGVSASWLLNIYGATAILLWLILALFTGLFACTLSHFNNSRWYYSLIGSTLWTGIEFFRGEMFALDFPWLSPGVGFAPSRLSPLVGTYGVSFLIIFTVLLIIHHNKRSKQFGVAGLVLTLLVAAQSWKLPRLEAKDPVSVMLVQNEFGSQNEITQQTLDGLAKSSFVPDIILWPEHALSAAESMLTPYSNSLEVSQQLPSLFVLGTSTKKQEGLYNTAITIEKGQVIGIHHKNHLVGAFNHSIKGSEAASVTTSLGVIGTPICFDNDHYDVVRRMVANGAEMITVPSRDNTHWGELQHIQHSQLFHHRAAENYRWMAIAASSGMSQIVDPHGNQISSLPLMTETNMIGQIERLNTRTIFNRFGYLIGPCCFYLSCGLLGFVFIQISRKKGVRLSQPKA